MRKVSQLKGGVFLSYASMALSIIMGIVYTPLMLRLLGKSEYGLYNTVASTISMLSILSLGFNSGYIRYYAKYKKAKDEEAISKLNGMFLLIFTAIGLVAFVCGLFLSFNLKIVFDEGLTAAEYKTARILMLLLTLNLAVSFPMGVFSHIISANERFIYLKVLGLVKTVSGPFLTLPLLLLGYGSIALVSVTVGVALFVDALYWIYVKKVLKQKFIFYGFEKGLLKEIFVYTSFIAINLIVDQINLNIDKFLLGRFRGTAAVAVYSIGYALYSYYMSFSTAISGVFTPRIHKIINDTAADDSKQRKELTDLFIKVGRIQFLVLGLIASGFIFFGEEFIYYWAGEGYNQSYYVALLLMLPSTIPLIQNVGIAVQRAQNRHQFRSIVYIAMALINLVVSIFLCQKYGAVGSALGTAISFIVANGFIMNIYYHKKCNINIIAFWKSILRLSVGLLIPAILGLCLQLFVDMYAVWKLLLFIGAYTLAYCVSMYFFGMNKEEKKLMNRILNKLFGRFKRKAVGVCEKMKCNGCYACVTACPKKCIRMVCDEEGFVYPQINKKECIGCGLCKKVCPILKKREKVGEGEPLAYAAIYKNEEVRKVSSSGGIFSTLASIVLREGGVVFGATFAEDFSVEHIYIEDMKDLPKLQGSKYVQSKIGDAYAQARELLEKGRLVYFSGTPCQIGGLLSFLGKRYNNLITQDLICHGVPSPLVWKSYVTYREKEAGAKTQSIAFRAKDEGWKHFSMSFKFENGKEYRKNLKEDEYLKAFIKNLSLRTSCFDCVFKSVARVADVTLADFWGIQHFMPELNDDMGISLVLLHSEKGKELFEKAQEDLICRKAELKDALEGNTSALRCPKRPRKRRGYIKAVKKSGFEVTKEYLACSSASKCVNALRKLKRKIFRR